MGSFRERLTRRARHTGEAAPQAQPRKAPPDLAQQVARLRRRVVDLEAEVQENRQLNRRVAELVDVVEELLLPADSRDEALLRERLEGYRQGR